MTRYDGLYTPAISQAHSIASIVTVVRAPILGEWHLAQDLRSMTAGSRLSVRSRITAWPSAAVRHAQEKSGVGEMRVLAHAIDGK